MHMPFKAYLSKYLLYAHARGTFSEVRLTTNLPALQGSIEDLTFTPCTCSIQQIILNILGFASLKGSD